MTGFYPGRLCTAKPARGPLGDVRICCGQRVMPAAFARELVLATTLFGMPIIDVAYGPAVAEEQLFRLARTLPHAVSLAVECPEEPYDWALQPGDVEIRFRPRGPYDVSGLDVVIEIRSKWFPSRAETRQERCDRLCAAAVEAAGTRSVGVYLSLPIAAWSQGE